MPLRSRSRDFRVTNCGSHYNGFTTNTYCKVDGLQEFCEDFHGNKQGTNAFLHDQRITHYPVLNGKRISGNGVTILQEYINNPIGYRPVPIDPRSYWGSLHLAKLNELAWRILAETNPSEPHVNVPASLVELRDLPGLVRGWGRNIIKDVARGNLAYQWAIAPLISDLRKLSNFQKLVNNRIQELENLREKRTLKRRVELGSEHRSLINYASNYLMHSNGGGVRGERYESHTYRMWGTSQWKLHPDTVLPPKGSHEMLEHAQSLVTGATWHGALSAAWELAPWSWLVDWCSNVGDMISATNNSIGLTWSKICLMRKSWSGIHAKPNPALTDSWISITGDYMCQRTLKERYPVVPVIPFPLPHIPFIDERKWSILASLAALRLPSRG